MKLIPINFISFLLTYNILLDEVITPTGRNITQNSKYVIYNR